MSKSNLQNFTHKIEMLGRKYERSKVFDDFLTAGICGLHQTNIATQFQIKDPLNEKLYHKTIKAYESDELKIFSELIGDVMLDIYETPYSDLLGEYFTLNITQGQNGQFFTPQPVCEMMSKMLGHDSETVNQRILDPACGSARMLLSYAKERPANFFYGADVSQTCAKMAVINMCLNGLRGEIAWMNTLSMEWFGGYIINQGGIGIKPIEKEASHIWSQAPLLNKQSSQLTLF